MGVRALFLVGFMGSGKTSVGQELARRLNWDFVDLDARIESCEGRAIPQIFQESGEPAFRLAESSALADLLNESASHQSSHHRVVALGGGAFIQPTNRELLRRWPTVFLEAPASELWQRSQSDSVERPLRGDPEQFARLYAERLPFYREATVIIETTGKPLAAICVEIESALQLGESRHDVGS